MTLAAAASSYAMIGCAVFPLMPRDKRPYGGTTGLLAASRDLETVGGWWAGRTPVPLKPDYDGPPVHASPRANIGLATGEVSGFWVLDIDGPDGAEALAALEELHGPLPLTVRQTTGKGTHYLFAWTLFEGRAVRNSAGKIGKGIDVRGDGGYIVAAPSIHPSGALYEWAPGRALGDMPLAAAPDWLLALTAPAPPAPAPQRPPRAKIAGRATRYGEAALTGACRDIEQARPGTQSQTLWDKSIHVGALVAGEEIERGYAEDALVDAGLRMQAGGKPWTRAQVESHVRRALEWADAHPKSAPERPGGPPPAGSRRQEPRVREGNATPRSANALWDAALPASRNSVMARLMQKGLSVSLAAWGESVRFHHGVECSDGEAPALLLPLVERPGGPVEALAIAPLDRAIIRITDLLGPAHGCAAVLSPSGPRGDLVVALDLADGWTLGAKAQGLGEAMGVVITPTLGAFAGAPLEDRFGRVTPDTPQADPARPPWTLADAGHVYLAARGDLRGAALRVRKFQGGTRDVRLEGAEALEFYGALASQAWTRAGANGVRILRPPAGACGFSQFDSGAA